jgi:hypothetical protein
MRKIVLAAVFATVSGITGASLAPAAFAQGRYCTNVDPLSGTCRSWGSTGGLGERGCTNVDPLSGGCRSWGSASGQLGRGCTNVDPLSGTCRSWR